MPNWSERRLIPLTVGLTVVALAVVWAWRAVDEGSWPC